MEYRDKPSIFEVNLLYLVLGILLLTVGSIVQVRELYSGLLITEYVLILLPGLLFLKIKGASIKKSLRLNRISIRQIILVIGITIFTYPIAVFFQGIFILILNSFKEMVPTTVPMPQDEIQYIISFFVIAVTPGICEEVMFRGVIMDAYGRLGYKKGIIISALLFGIFHFNLLNLVGPTILGIVFGIIVYKTNSIYSAMIGHTVNNSIALTLGFVINKFQHQIDDILMEPIMSTEVTSAGIGIIIPFLFLILCFYMVRIMISNLEPIDEVINYQDKFSLDNTSERDFSMEESLDYDKVSYRPNRFERIKYLPVLIITLIFIFINWVSFLL